MRPSTRPEARNGLGSIGGAPECRSPTVEDRNGVWQTNVLVNGQVVATVDSSGNATYLAANMLGTTKMTVNAGGVASSEATYYPYGVQKATLGTEYTFTNQIRDAKGIDHFWMRPYSSALGRWLTPDPAGTAAVDPSNPQSWNRYAYVLNNPASLADPFGLFGVGPCPVGQEYAETSAGTTECEPAGGGPNPLDPTNVYFGPSGSGGGGVPIPLISAKIPNTLTPTFCADAPPDLPVTPSFANLNANIQKSADVASLDPTGGISSLIWFYGQVATGGPWDYKQYGSQFVDFGNFNYGATCGAMGRSLSFCQSAAGLGHMLRYAKLEAGSPFTGRHPIYGGAGLPFLMTPYGDQAADDGAIAIGYSYGLWKEYCG